MPIDPDFKDKMQKVEEHQGHPVWKPADKPEALGVHGEKVCVDWDSCEGCGDCIEACPSGVFELIDTEAGKKSDPVNEDQCIACLACETICPTTSIKVFVE